MTRGEQHTASGAPFGGRYVSGATAREWIGGYVGAERPAHIGGYISGPTRPGHGRFTDTDPARPIL